MATVGELAINVTGHNSALLAAISGADAALRNFGAASSVHGTSAAAGLARVGVAAAAMAGATALATAGSISAAANFQDQLAIINTIAHQTPDELNRTGEAIRAMAVSSGEPLSNLTSAFYDLLSAGVPVSQAMDVLGSSTTLAIGGLATTQQTVDLLTTAMNAYGLNAAGVATATDQFALAIQDGKVKADQIAATFADIAPIAKTAGIGIDEIAAAYAVMTGRGTPAAEVTTQMNRAIVELLKPNADLVALQKETGKTFADIAGQKGLVEALEEMRAAAAAAGVPFQDLFGRLEGYKFALATTGPENARYRDELLAMHSAAGTAAAQAAERMDTFNRQAAILSNSIGDLGIEIGTGFLPQMTSFVQQVGGAVQGAAAWARENPGLANTILTVVGGLSALTAGVIFLGPILGALATAFGIILSPITLVAAAVGGLAAHFGLLGEGPKTFVDGLAGSLSNLLPATGPIRDAFNIIGDAIGAIPAVIAGAQAAFDGLVSTLSLVWSVFGPSVIDAVSGAFNTLSGIVTAASNAFAPLVAGIGQWISQSNIAKTATDLFWAALGVVRGVLDALSAVFNTVTGWISTFLQHLTASSAAGGTARGVFDALQGVLRTVWDVLSGIVGVISTVIGAIIEVGTRTGFFTGVLNALKVAADLIGGVLGFIGDVLRTLFGLFGQVADVVGGAVSGAFGILKGVIDGLTGVIQGIVDALKGVITLAGQAVDAVSKIDVGKAITGPQGIHLDTSGHDPIGDALRNIGLLPKFDMGGVVPGPTGSPQLAVVHGGETVTPPGGGSQGSVNVIHTHVHLDGREIAEVVERVVFDNASNYSSGFVGSPQTT